MINMDDTAIRLEHVSKKFCRYLRRSMLYGIKDIGRNMLNISTRPDRLRKDEFWAVDDVSFDLHRGETLGLIGPNGSGKSTILKMLNGIFMPDKGKIEIKGRVGALIEIGAGFHPVLTGRENIYINGTILGMSKKEIDKKFDAIVDFADIGDFLDTPVKFYSSGMVVRLGFSVAVHCESEILLVDEVLAVGDIAFQSKCLGKMADVTKEGRTVVFISHNMAAIRSMCDSTIRLNNGHIVERGATSEVVADYEASQLRHLDEFSYIMERSPEEVNNKGFYFRRVEMLNTRGEHATTFRYGDKIKLILELAGEPAVDNYNVIFHIYNELGYYVCAGAAAEYHNQYFNRKIKKIGIEIGPLILTSGRYRVIFIARLGDAGVVTADTWDNAIGFTVVECQPFESRWEMPAYRDGSCVINHSFYEIE